MMRKIGRWSLLLFTFLLFSGLVQATADEKLVGPLKELSEYYKIYKKITPVELMRFKAEREQSPERKKMISRLSGLKKTDSKLIMEPKTYLDANGVKRKAEPFYQSMILEEVQANWGHPDFDVLRCKVAFRGNPDSLVSDLCKVISAVPAAESEHEDAYILVLEFAATELNRLAALPSITAINPTLRNDVNNDKGTLATGASRIRRQGGGSFTGITGKGTIVGVIDTGIDWTHEDFVDPKTGETRILYIWDSEVNTPGKSPADLFGGDLSSFTTGTVWTKEEIDNGLCTSTDSNGHGTHVTGSAAGNGYATGRYIGMAPLADIIFVKGINGAGNNGATFVYELAKRLGKPCAVNMSYGPSYPIHYMARYTPYFPGDNTDTDAQFFKAINSYFGTGHIPVKSAGNSGHWNSYSGSVPPMVGSYHIEGQLTGAQSKTHILNWYSDWGARWIQWGYGPISTIDFPVSQMGIWYTGAISITMVSPNGGVIGPFVHGTSGEAMDTPNNDGKVVYTLNNPVASNGCYYGTFSLQWGDNPTTTPIPGDWQIIIEPLGGSGSVSYDIWCADFDKYFDVLYNCPNNVIYNKFTGNFTHANYINDEGASDYLITVGNYVTKTGWTDQDGNNWTYQKRPILNQISDSSSPGPSRDRRMKPDIAAPGTIIVSSASKDGSAWANPLYLTDPKHGAMSGTSMAAPHVTGGVALMLQKRKDHTVASVRHHIKGWAKKDWFTQSGSPNAWGAGKFNVLPLNEPPVAVIAANKSEIVLDDMEYTVNFDGSGSYDPEGFPLTYTFAYEALPLTSGGQTPAAQTFTVEGSSATLNVDPEIEGRYRASLMVNDTIVDSPVVWTAYIETRFYPILPPVNLTVSRSENDLILFKLYTNTVNWAANPDNKSKVDYYILYKKAKDAADSTYAEVGRYEPTDALQFVEKGLSKTQLYTYKVVAVNMRGVVSDPIVAGN